MVCAGSCEAEWSQADCPIGINYYLQERSEGYRLPPTITDDADLEPLARLGRKLKGRTQQLNHGADIFLANPQGKYIGRTCQWQECRPGKRLSCDALNCGRRPYLHDDLKAVALSEETMRTAIELWPALDEREGLPPDLAETIRQLSDV